MNPTATINDPLLRQDSAAQYLDVSERTLEAWRLNRRGPTYVRVGRNVRYRRSALDAYLDARTVEGSASQ